MANEDINALVKGLIETQIVQALNDAPEAIDKLVKAALSKPVDAMSGRYDGYGTKVPYLDYLVGEEIRIAAANACRKVIAEQSSVIEEQIRKGLSSETVVAAITKALVDTASQNWKIDVKFVAEEKRSY